MKRIIPAKFILEMEQKTGVKMQLSQLAEISGATKQLINQYKDKELPDKYSEKVLLYFSKFINTENDTFVNVNFFPDIYGSCGNGVFVQSENYETIKLPKIIINKYSPSKEYSVIIASGDSMENTIKDGDKLLVESFNIAEQIIDNEIYVFCFNDELYVKRLSKNIDQILVRSDNKDYPVRYINGDEMNNIQIQGRIIGLVRSYLKESDF